MYYKKQAKKPGVSSAYTAAITDLCAKIGSVDTSKAANVARSPLQPQKKVFLNQREGNHINTQWPNTGTSNATKAVPNRYIISQSLYMRTVHDIIVSIEATDQTGNVAAYKQHRTAAYQ